MAITVKGIEALEPGEWLTDTGNRGAGALRAKGSANGARFYFRYRDSAGRYDDYPLGAYDAKGRDGLTLVEAKRRAGELSRRYQAGDRDLRVALEIEEAERAATLASKVRAEEAKKVRKDATLTKLLAAYVEHLRAAGKPSARAVEAAFERNITEPFPKIAELPADEVTVDAIMPVFHRLTVKGKWREAEKLRAYVRAAYTAARRARNDAGMHAFAGFKVAANPLTDLDVSRPKEAAAKATEAARERKWALAEEQLRAYWRRIGELPEPDRALLRFHLLTGGQRVEQLARLTTSDYDGDRKTVTLRDTKGRRKAAHDHVVPLIPDALHALEAMRGKEGAHLFTLTEGAFAAGYHNVWERMRPVAEAMLQAGEIERTFSPGTIRRTVESRLQAMGVSREVRGYLLSHGLGGVQARHYEAHEYDGEKREALEKLRALLEPKKGKVVAFHKKSGSRR